MNQYQIEYMHSPHDIVKAGYWSLDEDNRWFNFHLEDGAVTKVVAAHEVRSITLLAVSPQPQE